MTIHILYVRMLLLHFAFVTESQSGSFAKSPLPYLPCCRAVTDSINELLNVCSTSGPGQKECDNALRKIEVYMCYMTHSLRSCLLSLTINLSCLVAHIVTVKV